MNRMLYLLLLSIVLVGCPMPSSEPTPTPHPATPVTPSEPEPLVPPIPMIVDYRAEWTVASTFSLKSTDFVILASDTDNPNRVYTWDGKHGRIHSQGITEE